MSEKRDLILKYYEYLTKKEIKNITKLKNKDIDLILKEGGYCRRIKKVPRKLFKTELILDKYNFTRENFEQYINSRRELAKK